MRASTFCISRTCTSYAESEMATGDEGMVRIKVIKKSQLIAWLMAVLVILALLAGAWAAWRQGAFDGKSGGAPNGYSAGQSLSADAPADGAGDIPAANAGAFASRAGAALDRLNVAGGAMSGLPDAQALAVIASAGAYDDDETHVYVVNMDLSGEPELTPSPDALSEDGGMPDVQLGEGGAADTHENSGMTISLSDGDSTPVASAAPLSAILAAGLSGDAGAPLAGRSILIYHTHTHESYEKQAQDDYVEISAYRTGDTQHSVVRVGAELKRLLEDMGASVYHDVTDYEQDALGTSYERSLETLERLRDEGRAFDLWIDLHRDAYAPASGEPKCVDAGGLEAARLMVLLGTGEGKSGDEPFDQKPDFERNRVWGQRLTDELNAIAPGICRPLLVKTGRYNQHISERSLLIEVGHNRNTLGQALNAMPTLARAIAATLDKGAE